MPNPDPTPPHAAADTDDRATRIRRAIERAVEEIEAANKAHPPRTAIEIVRERLAVAAADDRYHIDAIGHPLTAEKARLAAILDLADAIREAALVNHRDVGVSVCATRRTLAAIGLKVE